MDRKQSSCTWRSMNNGGTRRHESPQWCQARRPFGKRRDDALTFGSSERIGATTWVAQLQGCLGRYSSYEPPANDPQSLYLDLKVQRDSLKMAPEIKQKLESVDPGPPRHIVLGACKEPCRLAGTPQWCGSNQCVILMITSIKEHMVCENLQIPRVERIAIMGEPDSD